MQRLYPKELADSSWDNTGLLVNAAAEEEIANEKTSLLLAIDLTTSVADEAITGKKSMVIAYHPFIFRGLKSISPNDSQQRSLLRLVRAGISVYCPHTAVDAAIGGVNDWLADGVSGGREFESGREVVTKVDGVDSHEGAGMGRIVKLKEPIGFDDLVKRIKKHLSLQYVQVALANKHKNNGPVSSVALCAGSGGSVLRGVPADVHFTGELGHHEALYLKENGISAIVCGHSNTERGFLPTLKKQLEEQFEKDGQVPDISISSTDKDPLEVV